MNDLHMEFTVSPWLMLLILPAFALIIAAFFFVGGKKSKRKRSNTNRVLAAVVQSIVAVLLISAISGMRFVYGEQNAQGELVILLDKSFTAINNGSNEFVREVLEANDGKYETAIVLFDNEQNVALPMGRYSAQEAYERYEEAASIRSDDSATDISSALLCAWNPATKSGLISNPANAKVLVISDGLQTDGDAFGTVRGLIRDGIRVDTSFFAVTNEDNSVTDIVFPKSEVFDNQPFDLGVTVYAAEKSSAEFVATEINEDGKKRETHLGSAELKRGFQTLKFGYSFAAAGLHRLEVRMICADGVPANNVFFSYYEVKESSYMLILEKYEGESATMRQAIAEDSSETNLVIETKNIAEVQNATAEELAKYGEISLYNIASTDMDSAFQRELYKYSHDLGGGVFTIGGFEKSGGEVVMRPMERDPDGKVPVAHAYKEADDVYASMLPVAMEDFQPAVAVVFVFDISGSMTGITGAPIFTAVQDAKYCLDLLNKRDYVGIVALENNYQEVAPLMPMTKRDEIVAAIDKMAESRGDATAYAPAVAQAVKMLRTCGDNVAVKHIVLLSDGGPGDKLGDYGPVIREANESDGITLTVVAYYKSIRYFDGDPEPYYFNHSYDVKGQQIRTDYLTQFAKWGGGSFVLILRSVTHELEEPLRKDLKLDELEEVGINSFHPRIGAHSPALGEITDSELGGLTLGGYFPSRAKLSGGAEVLLYAETAPLYAEWGFGEGRVGSFMADLEGVWSKELLESEIGRKLISGFVLHLLQRVEQPVEGTLSFTLAEDNYRTQVNIYGFDKAAEPKTKLAAFVTAPDGSTQKFDPDALSVTHNRIVFDNHMAGIYTIYIMKVASTLDIFDAHIHSVEDVPSLAVREVLKGYKAFSYSAEYASVDPYSTGQKLLSSLSTRKVDGDDYQKFVYDAEEVFADYGVTYITADPRPAFVIAAIVLYLVGVALRKFRLPHPRQKRKAG